MANDYVFFDPRKKAQQQAEDEKKLSEKEEERLRNQEIGEKAVKVIAEITTCASSACSPSSSAINIDSIFRAGRLSAPPLK